ncbi:MAG: serine/threonine-protein kinase [Planctomycetota bacterium]
MRLDRFLDEFWNDADRGQVRPLADYQARYPDLTDAIADEYALYLSVRASARPGSGESGETQSSPLAALATESTPHRIERYEVVGKLAEGGMGTLFRAHDPTLGREVVLKTVRSGLSSDVRALTRFRREVRIAGRLEHPHLCPVLDVLRVDNRVWVVMPLLRGTTLAEHLQQALHRRDDSPPWMHLGIGERASASATPPSNTPTETEGLPAVLLLVERISLAVHAAHEAGIVHRDLKPSNVMVQPDGTPVIMDFGLATRPGEETSITLPGQAPGTPAYMAPEQLDGMPGAVDRRTDVYALGVLLYEVLTLHRPYAAGTLAGLSAAIRRGEPVPPRKLVSAMPRDLEAVVLRAMAVESRCRYPTAEALARDIANVRLLRPTEARPMSLAGRVMRRARRNRTAAALASITLVALGGAIVMWRSADRAVAMAARMAPDARVGRLERLKNELLRIDATETNSARTMMIGESSSVRRDRVARERRQTDGLKFRRSALVLVDLLAAWGVHLDAGSSEANATAVGKLEPEERAWVLHVLFAFTKHACIAVQALAATESNARGTGEAEPRIAIAWRAVVELLDRLPDLVVGAAAVHAADALPDVREEVITRLLDLRLPSTTAAELEFLSWLVDQQPAGGRDASRQVLVDALRRHPGSFWLRYRRGQLALITGERAEAVLQFEIAQALQPRSFGTLINLGLAYDLAGVPARAAPILEQALTLDPESVLALSNLAGLRRDQGNLPEAERLFRKALDLAPEDAAVRIVLGLTVRDQAVAAGQQERFAEAIALFEQAARDAHENWEGSYRLGESLQMLGKHEEAIAAFVRGLEAYPQGIDLRVSMAESLWDLGRHREALDVLAGLVADRPDASAGFDLLATYVAECPDPDLAGEFRDKLETARKARPAARKK